MTILQSSLLNPYENLLFGISTRLDGVSPQPFDLNLSFSVGDNPANVQRNRELFFGSLGIPLDRLAIPKQVHSGTVVRVESPGEYPACDALVTNILGVYLCVSVADCTPLLLYDPHKRVVAAVHAGWRGTVEHVAGNAVKKMKEQFGSLPENIIAYVGPAACSCCYNVGKDVASEFDATLVRKENDQIYIDLKTANVRQLVDAGVPKSQIEISGYCTICHPELFHSYRRDRESSGRMMSVIGMS
jgi:hypothetical protein